MFILKVSVRIATSRNYSLSDIIPIPTSTGISAQKGVGALNPINLPGLHFSTISVLVIPMIQAFSLRPCFL